MEGGSGSILEGALRPAALLDKDELRAQLPLGFACLELNIGVDSNGRALCPWHDDHSPSFGLYTDGRDVEKFACPVCAVSGDVFDLIQRVEGGSFSAAVERAGEMLEALGDREHVPTARPKADFDAEGAHRVVDEARTRSLDNDGWLCVAIGLRDESAPEAHRRQVDAWLRDQWRLGIGEEGEAVMPHYDSAGTLRGVKFRGLDGTKWCRAGSQFTSLYGSWHARQSRALLLCEGETDAIWADAQLEPIDVYALPSGAGRFAREWAQAKADIYFLAFDGDEPGDRATSTWVAALPGKDVRVLQIPRGEDLRSWSPELRGALTSATRYGGARA